MLDQDLAAIKSLKLEYFRLLDAKRWKELGELFTDDATTAYDDGEYAWQGRDAIVGFLSSVLGADDCVSKHGPAGPADLRVLSEDRAIGDWPFADDVEYRGAGWRVRGEGEYHDEYVKVDGDWRIAHTGYDRSWEVLENISLRQA